MPEAPSGQSRIASPRTIAGANSVPVARFITVEEQPGLGVGLGALGGGVVLEGGLGVGSAVGRPTRQWAPAPGSMASSLRQKCPNQVSPMNPPGQQHGG